LSGPESEKRAESKPRALEPSVEIIEAHGSFVQHIEAGQGRMKALSVITIVVAFFLLTSYFYQVVTPFTTGTNVVTVNLLDPTLLALEAILIVVTFAWLYIGVVNYLFASRLGRQIKDARAKEKEIERRLGAAPP
jgi:type III secretory pathway component EscU